MRRQLLKGVKDITQKNISITLINVGDSIKIYNRMITSFIIMRFTKISSLNINGAKNINYFLQELIRIIFGLTD